MNSLQEINKRINDLITKMTSAVLTADELMELEKLAQKLYERAIILSYKAKEEKVYQKKEAIEAQETVEVNVEPIIPKETPQQSVGEIQFDFSDEMESSIPEPAKEEKIDKTPEVTPVEVVEPTDLNDKENHFFKHFSTTYQEVAHDKINNVKIASLKGAFGLNDKMLFVRELFGGNSDLFNQTMENLDQLNDNQTAFSTLSKIAVEQNWNMEQESINEFIHIISRKYVD